MNEFEIIIRHYGMELLSLEEMALAADIHPDLARTFVEFGLVEPVDYLGEEALFEPKDILRIRTIQRLRADVGVNLPGAAVVLDLLDKIRQLQMEVEWYRQHL